ncbi:HU family DNA-binding protein [Granulicella arctica]|uniref:HU family DNA-binding protein n=1 Tax=Granulicella arctica TaxID=940613 RepID=UPI0021DF7C98|nr:HU family DNA-binding protein [Granulicella arctica]
MATKKSAAKKAIAKKIAKTKLVAPAKKAAVKKAAAQTSPVAKMTRTQLIRQMAEQMEVSPKQVTGFFDLLIETATTQTRTVGEFTIPGLGKLLKAQRAARMGRNPATGESIKIAAKTTVKFRLSKAAKDAVVPPKK